MFRTWKPRSRRPEGSPETPTCGAGSDGRLRTSTPIEASARSIDRTDSASLEPADTRGELDGGVMEAGPVRAGGVAEFEHPPSATSNARTHPVRLITVHLQKAFRRAR